MMFWLRAAVFTRYGFIAPLVIMAALGPRGCMGKIPVDIPGVTTMGPSDEEQIADVLDDIHRGMQSRRVYKVLAYISRTYRDDAGRDYAALEQYLTDLFRAYKAIQITRVRPKIIVQGDMARAVETFGTRAEPFNANEDRPIEIRGQMNIYLERIDGNWMVVEWGRVF
ncbi:MAG: hypothetical protein FJY92_08400 [Candidatus Hydrogenedentes bacterium]|nr:hypothetical protein [Candidatus Hydrogenedentota bacterium]